MRLDLSALGLDADETLTVHDEVTGARYDWGQSNYVRLTPSSSQPMSSHEWSAS